MERKLASSLNGCVALVTGGGRGIGRAIALALARAGADVAVTWREREAPARDACRRIEALGRKSFAVAMDAGEPDDVRRGFADVRGALGPVRVLINNAAMAQEKAFEELGVGDWDRVLEVNLRGPFLCCQQGVTDMLAEGFGRIVNVVSVGGQWGGTRQVHYATSKAGLIGLTRSLARLYAGRGITVNAVSPGLVATEMTVAELSEPAARAKLATIPAGRTGTPQEVAATVAFLASPAAAYVTGQTVNVNGGMYMG